MLAAWLLSISTLTLSVDSLTSSPIPEINQQKAQYFPFYSAARKELYFTGRTSINSDEELHFATWDGNQFTSIQSLSSINQESNDGTACLSADGNTLIFSGCDYRNSFGACDLYESQWVNGAWTKPRNLGIQINSHDWEGQPSLSADGMKLYFTSDRPGGAGKRDIWMSEKDEQGRWKIAKNLGTKINSSSDEQGPYWYDENEILIFSSDKKGGKGGLDFYQSRLENGQWVEAKNLSEVNSATNEAGICRGIHPNEFFISRNQPGNSIEEAIHRILIPPSYWLAKINPPKIDLVVQEIKPVKIQFQEVSFDDIQFANNQWKIPMPIPQSLEKLIHYLQENPNQKIEIRGHTDEIGLAKSNQLLSEKRANAIKTYLIQQGISSSRIQTKGMSFLRPKVARNQAEARKFNRRIEIILIE